MEPASKSKTRYRGSRFMSNESLIKSFAIRAALGNNGGNWADHYTEAQKEYWRRFVRDMVVHIKIGLANEDDWSPRSTAPEDGSHILAATGPFDRHNGFDQRPPAVVHYWNVAGEEGFYLSAGARDDDEPYHFTHWRYFGPTPKN
jgi:hypothetical protein